MARSPILLNAERSARLLRRQRYRERHAQAVLNGTLAGQYAAERAVEDARAQYQATRESAAEAMRGRWDTSNGALLSIDDLTALRGAEHDTDMLLQAAQQAIDTAEQALADFPAQIEAATAALSRETAQTLRRERITAHCQQRATAILTQRDERALEDDLISRESSRT